MIDKYVEKDIYRQIMISKLLFKNGTLNVNDLVNHFKISRNTVVAYVSQIEELISIDAA
ncbi:DeoR family transcriptional regulator, partial [Carnobacterium sp.]|uniref:DeoR family transcriptional regulator n=2 Tax=unclassified Carnobacterium TaxID=257487 RepID=UPI003FA5909B